MKKALSSIIVIGVVGFTAFGLSSAFFSDTETSSGNTFQAGELDLEIDNDSYLNGVFNDDTSWELDDLTNQLFFDFHDIKPNDFGEDTISLHAENDYWACVEIEVTKNDDNTCTDPELIDDPACNENDPDDDDGELGQTINFAWWVDDGDNVFETDEEIFLEGDASTVLNSSIVLADSITNLFETSGPLIGSQVYYLGKAWCFGTLTENPDGQDGFGDQKSPATVPGGGFQCDGSQLDNATQTDVLMGDIAFSAYQARNNPGFLCEIDCETAYASGFTVNEQGRRKDGTAVLANRSVPSYTFGAPQTTGTPYDTVTPNSFFSLGFPKNTPPGSLGRLTLSFTNPFFDTAGPDLKIFEVTGGSSYPDEKVKVEVSQDGSSWTVVSASLTRDGDVDISPLTWAQYVRLTDVSTEADFEPTADGYDIDAVQAYCGTP